MLFLGSVDRLSFGCQSDTDCLLASDMAQIEPQILPGEIFYSQNFSVLEMPVFKSLYELVRIQGLHKASELMGCKPPQEMFI